MKPTLRFLSPPTFTEDQLREVFSDTREAIAFFEEKAGKIYQNDFYTQVLLRNGSGQELDDMAVMGQNYGTGVLAC